MRRRLLGILGIVLLLLFGLILFRPVKTEIQLETNPESTYVVSVKQIDALRSYDTQEINPICRTKFLTHEKKTKHVIIFLHGFTNCPHQFHELGSIFFDLGYNVLIPRMPHHGLIDRMTPEQAQLTAEDLVIFTNEIMNIAPGLGEQVTIVGFSAGGILTAWVAQNLNTHQAVIISPAFGLGTIPTVLTKPAVNLIRILPNFFIWWDPRLKTNLDGPQYAYPRFSSHALGEILRLGISTQIDALQSKPATQSILVITNAGDSSVNNNATNEVVNSWQRTGVEDLQAYEFEARLQLNHDLIDPRQVDQRVDIVYPVLIDLITDDHFE